VIVVDDGSKDETPRILASFGSKIKVITQRNRGPSAARNVGIQAAGGEYVALLDADDLWYPPMLSTSLAALSAEPEAVLSFTDFLMVGRVTQETTVVRFEGAPSLESMLSRAWCAMPSTVVLRKQLTETLLFEENAFPHPGGEDILMWLQARERGPFVHIPEVLALHRSGPPLELYEKFRPGTERLIEILEATYGPRALGLRNDLRATLALWMLQGALKEIDAGHLRTAGRIIVALMIRYPWFLLERDKLARVCSKKNLLRAGRILRLAHSKQDSAAGL
jgi:glycosyltransferase involved in cell wall biosynthesis